MKKIWLAVAVVAALAAVGVGVWQVAHLGTASEVAAERLSARETLARHLAEGRGVAAADWLRGGQIGEGGEAGNHARFEVAGAGGRAASAFLVKIGDTWHLVSLSEGAPQCSAVERYGFPSAMISDCRVGEAQTVAEALASALAGEDVSGVRLVGTISLPPDPSCDCVLLSSGGSSVRLNISASALRASGIAIGDTVVISGGLGGNLSVDAASVIRASEDGTPDSVVAATGGGRGRDSESGRGGTEESGNAGSGTGGNSGSGRGPAPEPAGTGGGAGTPQGSYGGGGFSVSLPGFPEWRPRLRYKGVRYTNPFDLDSSGGEAPSLSGS